MLKLTLKFLLTFALCYWLLTNGKLDFSLIIKTIHSGYFWLLGMIFLIIRILINSFRFKIFLENKSDTNISYGKIVSFDAVGNFFSIILPGSAAGDVIRFFYYKNINAKLSAATIGSLIIVDRMTGLLGLTLLGSIVGLIQFEEIRFINPALISLIYINIFFMVGIALFILIFFSNLVSQNFVLKKILCLFQKLPKLAKIFSEMLSLQLPMPILLKNILISVIGQSFAIICFWILISPFLPDSISIFKLFAILPIGLIGSSLPISPAGLGVGHLFFENLFKMLHISNGASLYNLFFIVNVLVCLLGAIPYLMIKNEIKKASDNVN